MIFPLHIIHIFLIIILIQESNSITIDTFPKIKDSDVYEVYYLESTFPPNTPPSIYESGVWSSFTLNHAGIGFKAGNSKQFTIELLCPLFLGGVFPSNIMSGGGSEDDDSTPPSTLHWNNSVHIQVGDEINSSYWRSASFLGEISGSVIVTMKDDIWEFSYDDYQPLSVVGVGGGGGGFG